MLPAVLADLFDYLESCDGPVDLDKLVSHLRDLKITREDVEDYVRFNDDSYRRNQIRLGKWYEALIICWGPGHKSYIHDHNGSSCAFRVIEGSAKEVICRPTGRTGEVPLVKPVDTRTLSQGNVCGSSSAHIHEVINPSNGEDLITLHIYSPPLNMRIYAYDEAETPTQATAVGTRA